MMIEQHRKQRLTSFIRMSGATAYLFDDEARLTGHWQITDRLGVYQQLQQNKAAAG